ncbi:nuclear transport factor 2 family protein [Mucilaginibacter sabulilitoris]|uniref:Nuclear transport factor 2 family protein n=1 Tax=Mucilaginibacter sabulilitoris TaxID=1173583 RepID=A0ABZ0TKT0_9SPHI|nr:nuclear transport factor 2 family protein [Mucilaginibacter sabulilitoris]WPU93406.1 nuclear transport factor 2 family protein [Mucilaginibacter sabulilitoris]
MKTLKLIISGIALLIVCNTAKADIYEDGENLTRTYAINTYVDAVTRGKLQGLNDVVDQNAKFSLLSGKKILSYTRDQVFESLRLIKNIEEDCTTSTSIMESNNDIAVVKVDMQFDKFVRSNYVTIANTGKGWKITNVYSVFKQL